MILLINQGFRVSVLVKQIPRKINIRGFRYAVIEKDMPDITQYGAINKIPGAMTIGITPSVARGDLFGDGIKTVSVQKLTGIELAVELNKVPLADRAVWQGNKIDPESGALIVNANDKRNFKRLRAHLHTRYKPCYSRSF